MNACLACGPVDRLRFASRSWLLTLAFCEEASLSAWQKSYHFEDPLVNLVFSGLELPSTLKVVGQMATKRKRKDKKEAF